MTYIKINNTKYPGKIISKSRDYDWDMRASKELIFKDLTYNDITSLFINDLEWSIIEEEKIKMGFETIENEYDNSDYCVAGDIIDHRDGTISVKMGKPTAEELLAMIMEGVSQ